ncbi:MAG: ATP-binding protein [Candidatus Wallbacteria bacterium]
MITFENHLYVEFPSKRDYIDFISNKVVSAINGVAQEIHSQILLDDPSQNKEMNIFGFGMTLSIDEALKNAVTHGNHLDPLKIVALSYLITSEKLEIVIRDQGIGFDHKNYKMPSEMDAEAEAGRGLLLIKNFMDEIKFNESGNEITMIKYLGKSSKTREDF